MEKKAIGADDVGGDWSLLGKLVLHFRSGLCRISPLADRGSLASQHSCKHDQLLVLLRHGLEIDVMNLSVCVYAN